MSRLKRTSTEPGSEARFLLPVVSCVSATSIRLGLHIWHPKGFREIEDSKFPKFPWILLVLNCWFSLFRVQKPMETEMLKFWWKFLTYQPFFIFPANNMPSPTPSNIAVANYSIQVGQGKLFVSVNKSTSSTGTSEVDSGKLPFSNL